MSSAILLFHPVWISVEHLTGTLAKQYSKDLRAHDRKMLKWLRMKTGMDRNKLTAAYFQEKWWDADEILKATRPGWVRMIANIRGVDDPFTYQIDNNAWNYDNNLGNPYEISN